MLLWIVNTGLMSVLSGSEGIVQVSVILPFSAPDSAFRSMTRSGTRVESVRTVYVALSIVFIALPSLPRISSFILKSYFVSISSVVAG